MQVFESFGSFLNEGQNPDWYYLFKQIGGRNIERKPAYMQDLFGRSSFVKMKDSQVDDLSVANIPVYTSKDIWGKMEPKYGPATEFKNTPGETIFIIFFNHEQGEMKDYYGMSAFVNTEGAKYMRYAFGFDFEPDLSSFAMGVPESLENEVEVEGEIDEAKGYTMEDIRYAMQQVFSEVGFDKALKRISKVKGGFQMNMSSYMAPASLEGYGMIKMFNDIMGHEFTMDVDSFKKGSVTSIVILESEDVNESRITVKRKYTEAYPQITVAKFAPIRDKIIEAIADGKISKEQFETIIKEFSNSSKKWARRNTHYFNVSEDGIALSKYGKRILAKIKPVNENE